MTLVQAASSKLSLSNRVYAILNLLSSADNNIEINERYEIYSQAYYDRNANGFTVSVKPKVGLISGPAYVLHVRCVDEIFARYYNITWWIADCGDTQFNEVRCCPVRQVKSVVWEEGKPVTSISRYHYFDEEEHPSKLSYDEVLVAVAVIRNKLYRGGQELDALYGIHQVMTE